MYHLALFLSTHMIKQQIWTTNELYYHGRHTFFIRIEASYNLGVIHKSFTKNGRFDHGILKPRSGPAQFSNKTWTGPDIDNRIFSRTGSDRPSPEHPRYRVPQYVDYFLFLKNHTNCKLPKSPSSVGGIPKFQFLFHMAIIKYHKSVLEMAWGLS